MRRPSLPTRAPRPLVTLAVLGAIAVAPAGAQERARAAAPDPNADLVPLGPDQRALLEAVPDERTPPTERFYFRSNEWRQDLLAPHLVGLRGAYVGVGSDQNYTMAALARAEVLFLVDFDRRVPTVHRIYGALLPDAPTPDALIARFEDAARDASLAAIDAAFEGAPDHAEALRIFRRHHREWHVYLRRVQGTFFEGRPVTWLADPALYARVRALFAAGRVVARNGDVTGGQTLRAVGTAARALGVPVRAVYFSNAEQFFDYTPAFVANMKAFPTDQRSVVLRTIRHRRIANAPRGEWHYMVHHFPDFLERIESGRYGRSFALVADLLAAGPPFLGSEGLSTMTLDTPRTRLESD